MIRRISNSRARQLKEYSKLKRAFLKQHPYCAVFPARRASDIHHIRGRTGRLLLDTRYWLAVSRAGHNWIHQNPALARQRGFLAPLGQWNKP